MRKLLSALGLSFAACSEDDPVETILGELVAWHGEHVTYHADPSAEVCAGTPSYVDGFAPFVASELGLLAPHDSHYLWLNREQLGLLQDSCTPWGCAFGEFATSRRPELVHEVVHIVTGSHEMNGWAFFTEGVAWTYGPWYPQSFGARYVVSSVPGEPLPDPRPMMLLRDPLEIHYGIAGSFVTLLLARHGPEPFVRLSQQLEEPHTMANLEATFQRVYGSDLTAEVDLFMHGSPCTKNMFRVIPYDCSMPSVAWFDRRQWSYTNVMDCRHGDVIGGVDAEVWPSARSVTMDIPTAGTHQLSLKSDGDVTVQIGACFGCPWESRYHVLKPDEPITVDLDAGPYYVRMVAESDASPTVALSVRQDPIADL